tara:strand:- start:1915 stop:2325 length:411 start_codon:yes stop_codon:yes gene_type:complete
MVMTILGKQQFRPGFKEWEPDPCKKYDNNELIQSSFSVIVDELDSIISDEERPLRLTQDGLNRIKSILITLNQKQLTLSEEKVQKKLNILYAYCYRQLSICQNEFDFSALGEIRAHFAHLHDSVVLCPGAIAPTIN